VSSRRWPSRLATTALSGALLAVCVGGPAVAATLGGLNGGSLLNQILTGPTLYVGDSFTGVGSSTLAGRVTDTGQTWTVSRPSFALNAAGTAAVSTNGATLATAWVPTQLTAYTAQVELTRTAASARQAGLYLNVDPTGMSGITVTWVRVSAASGNLVLGKVTGGNTITVLNTRTSVPLPANTTQTLTVVCNGAGTYTISLGATGPYQVTLSAPDQATFGANTRAGLVTNQTTATTLDNFSVQP